MKDDPCFYCGAGDHADGNCPTQRGCEAILYHATMLDPEEICGEPLPCFKHSEVERDPDNPPAWERELDKREREER